MLVYLLIIHIIVYGPHGHKQLWAQTILEVVNALEALYERPWISPVLFSIGLFNNYYQVLAFKKKFGPF